MNHTLPVLLSFIALAAPPSEMEAREAMARAVKFFDEQVSVEGAYLWAYSEDLELREGEGKADATDGWVQPPGTPSVGLAYLRAYARTGEAYLLEAARRTGEALVYTQLESGGWTYRIEFDLKARKHAYRREPGNPEGDNVSTLDDNTTQEALRFLMQLDQLLEFKDESVHEAVLYGLDALLKVQYPNGAWPQRFSGPADPEQHPVKQASYPESWPREFPNEDYKNYYTFNDNAMADVMDVMLDAWEVYEEKRYRDAAIRGGEFMLLAQMPEPQPGWAQQYNLEMQPAWARKFEPAAITGGEAQGVMRTLIMLAKRTGEKRFLEPIPRALVYYRSSLLPDGKLARFYELQTNKPLYFTKEYVLTYDDGDMPTHYSFKVASGLEEIQRQYEAVKNDAPDIAVEVDREALAAAAEAAINSLDERGAWVTDTALRNHELPKGTGSIQSREFINRLDALSAYIALL